MQAYPLAYRQEVIELYEQGKKTAEIAELMRCSKPWARGLKQQLRETGSILPRRPVRKTSSATYDEQDQARLRVLLAQKPDATLAEIIAHIGKPIAKGNVSRTLKRMGLPRKKSPPMPASRIART